METEATILDSVLVVFLPVVASVVVLVGACLARRLVLDLVKVVRR